MVKERLSLYQDAINVGGVVVPAQAVQAANAVSGKFTSEGKGGILGLAFDAINTIQPTPQ